MTLEARPWLVEFQAAAARRIFSIFFPGLRGLAFLSSICVWDFKLLVRMWGGSYHFSFS